MPSVLMNVPAGLTGLVQTPLGLYSISGGQVTVDSQSVEALRRAGFTTTVAPVLSGLPAAQQIALTAPAGQTAPSQLNLSSGRDVPVINGVAIVTAEDARGLIAAGWTTGAALGTLGDLVQSSTSFTPGQPGSVTVSGLTPGSRVSFPRSLGGAARFVRTTTTTGTIYWDYGLPSRVHMPQIVEDADGYLGSPHTTTFALVPTSGSVTPTLNGFYLNGSTNPTLKAAVARVKAGTGRARFAVSGDSTSAGEGGGALINTIYFQNARPNRPSSVIAQQLSSAGVRALDTGFLGDNGAFVGSKASLTDYDPRVQASWKATSSTATQWSDVSAQTWPGGAILGSSSGAPLTFAPSDPVDTFEVVVYNSTGGSGSAPLSFLIDGAAPASVSVASGTATVSGSTATVFNGTGFSKLLVKAAGPGNHTLSLSSTTTLIALRSVLPYNSQLPAVDIENFAVRAATAANQASTNANGFYNLDALKFDAPDFTMINLGLNDINLSVAVSTYTANLQAIITAAKLSGDVLLIFPHYGKTGSGFVNNIDAYHAAAKSLAASNNVALFSLYDYYGTSLSDGSQFADGVVHPTAALYAQFGAVEAQAINAMLSS